MIPPTISWTAARGFSASRLGSCALRFALPLMSAVRQERLLVSIMFGYWVCGLIVAGLADTPPEATVTTYLTTYLRISAVMIVLLIAGRGAGIMICDSPARPLTQLYRELRTSLVTPERIAHAMPILVGIPVFAASFTVIKKSIPIFAPFAWDAAFEKWDRWLHGGIAPWQILQPILGSPAVTYALNWSYNLWFYVLGVIWAYHAFSQRDLRLRRQFFLTLLLGWIVL
ncbi:MAG: hypothetical protein ACREQV_15520, partial [Candidatus Binatia bacterium]